MLGQKVHLLTNPGCVNSSHAGNVPQQRGLVLKASPQVTKPSRSSRFFYQL